MQRRADRLAAVDVALATLSVICCCAALFVRLAEVARVLPAFSTLAVLAGGGFTLGLAVLLDRLSCALLADHPDLRNRWPIEAARRRRAIATGLFGFLLALAVLGILIRLALSGVMS